MATKSIDLVNLFTSVTQQLVHNEDALNQADEYNHDHGTNMVSTFQTITDALRERQGASNSEALAYAAQQLTMKGTSGSAKLYAQNLRQAANNAASGSMTPEATLELLQTLMGGNQERQAEEAERVQQSQAQNTASGRGLGGLFSSLMGAVQQQSTQPSAGVGLGGLLGGMLGDQEQEVQPSVAPTGQAGLGNIMSIITSLMGTGQSTGTGAGAGLGALVQAFTGGSGTVQGTARTQSSGVVISTILKALTSMMG